MSTFSIILYVIDAILIGAGITFKILTKRRMGGKKKEDKSLDLKDYVLLKKPDTLCFECPNIFVYCSKKKKTDYYCRDFEHCLNSSVDDEHSEYEVTEEVSENE